VACGWVGGICIGNLWSFTGGKALTTLDSRRLVPPEHPGPFSDCTRLIPGCTTGIISKIVSYQILTLHWHHTSHWALGGFSLLFALNNGESCTIPFRRLVLRFVAAGFDGCCKKSHLEYEHDRAMMQCKVYCKVRAPNIMLLWYLCSRTPSRSSRVFSVGKSREFRELDSLMCPQHHLHSLLLKSWHEILPRTNGCRELSLSGFHFPCSSSNTNDFGR
jgi:hypothetical protein